MHPHPGFSSPGVSALGICSPYGFSSYKKMCSKESRTRSLEVCPQHSLCSPQGQSNSRNTQEGKKSERWLGLCIK